MSEVAVRRSGVTDAARVRALAEGFTASAAEVPVQVYRTRFEQLIADDEWYLPVAQVAGEVVGYALAQDFGPGLRATFTTGRLHDLYVDPAARRCGAGTALVHSVVDWAGGRDQAMILDWQASPGAVEFYERLGFTPDWVGDYPECPGFTLDLRQQR